MSETRNYSVAEMEPIFDLCRRLGVAQLKGDFGEVTFFPPAPQHAPIPTRATAESEAEEDEEEARYQKEMAEWEKTKGRLSDDDKGIDG